MLEQQILAAVIAVVSGPGGVASFLRSNLLGRGPQSAAARDGSHVDLAGEGNGNY